MGLKGQLSVNSIEKVVQIPGVGDKPVKDGQAKKRIRLPPGPWDMLTGKDRIQEEEPVNAAERLKMNPGDGIWRAPGEMQLQGTGEQHCNVKNKQDQD